MLEYVGFALLSAWLMSSVGRRASCGIRVATACAGASLTFVSFGPSTLGGLLLGICGPLSAASLVIVATLLASSISARQYLVSRTMCVCLVALAIVFYPPAFGLSKFDLYELGYRGLAIPALMLSLIAVGWWFRAPDVACWIGITALLYMLDAYGSRNLWDYLIFPADAAYAAGALVLRALRSRHEPAQLSCSELRR